MRYCPNKHTDFSYYENMRRDILTYIPKDVKCILSVGCGAGITEAELVKSNIKVVGIEINHKAAMAARERGIIVLEGDALDIDLSKYGDLFDCLIYADVLEHLTDPLAVMTYHVKFLRDNGTVIVSVPNFRHYSVFQQLFIQGYVNYVDAGILDRTHIRITTRKMILQWFEQLGLKVLSNHYNMGKKSRILSICLIGLAKEFLSRQICLVAQK